MMCCGPLGFEAPFELSDASRQAVDFLARRQIHASQQGTKPFGGFLFEGGEKAFGARFDVLGGALRPFFEIRAEALRLAEKPIQRPLLVTRDELARLRTRALQQALGVPLQPLHVAL